MNLSGPRVVTGRRKLLKALLVGISGDFQRIRHQGGGEAYLTCTAIGHAHRVLSASGNAALAFAASGAAGFPTKSGSGAATLSASATGSASARRAGVGTAVLLTAAGGAAVARRQASGFCLLLSAAAGSARAQRFASGSAKLTTFGTGGGAGPVTDPLVQSINSNGWSITANTTPPTMLPDSAPKFLMVQRAGYSSAGTANTQSDILILTRRIREAYPSQASLTTDQIALSGYVYADDTIPGGIANNSTESSPKPVANWVQVDKRVVGNSLRLEVVAFHRDARNGTQVACVEFTVTDGTNTVTQKVADMSILGHSGDLHPVIGYAATLDISSLADVAITANAKVYPHFGVASSVRDSAAGTANSREFCPQVYKKNVSQAASPPIAVVLSTGNDGTGVVSTSEATAAATPFLTVAGALAGLKAATGLTGGFTDGCEVRLGDGVFAFANPTTGTYQSASEVTITRLSSVTKAQARLSIAANGSARQSWIRCKDITIQRTGTSQFNGLRLVLENIAYENGGAAAALIGTTAGTSLYILGAAISGPSSQLLNAGTGENRLLRGIDYGTIGTAYTVEPWLVLGSTIRGANLSNRGTRTQSGGILGFNVCPGVVLTWAAPGANEDIDGFACVQNVVEYTAAANNPAWSPSNDAKTGNVRHLIDHHNTFVGTGIYGRSNYLYNETSGTLRTHKLTSCVGLITPQFNTKHDIFAGANLALPDANLRVGGWSAMNGVGFEGLFSMFAAANPASEHPEYPGLNASLGTSGTARNDPLFVDFQATTAGPIAGVGGGNYRLQAGSPCIGRVKRQVLPFDLDGNPRSATASASGAYERLAA